MSLNFAAPSALEHFGCLVEHDAGFPLLEAAASLALDAEPDVDVQAVLTEVDAMTERLRRQLPAQASAMQRAFQLNEYFYEQLGFAGNANHFADPRNSYLHRVLSTRRGIPISLAVLWMELAQGIGLSVQGISFPGHFLVKVQVPEGLLVQDPLTGRGLTQAQLAERLEPFRESWGLSEDDMAPLHLFLQPATGRDIIERMLRNLLKIHSDEGAHARMLGVLDRLIVLRPQAWDNYRDRGLVLAQLGRTQAALKDLQTYVRQAPNPTDLPVIEARMALLRATG